MFVCFSTDGYIVCEEHEEILRAAWAEEQEIQKQKEKEVSGTDEYRFTFFVHAVMMVLPSVI